MVLVAPSLVSVENPMCTQAQPAKLTSALLRGFSLTFGGREVPIPQRKGRALLALLLLSDNGKISRERAAGLLWSEFGEEQARASLRQILMGVQVALRSLDIDPLGTTRFEISLTEGTCNLDINQIIRSAEARELPSELLTSPRLAESLLQGYDDIDPAFNQWLREARLRLFDRLQRALEGGYNDQTIARRERRNFAEASLLLDPTHEAACRSVMRLAAEDGEINVALHTYEALYKVLGDELDMEPSTATQRLIADIKLGLLDPKEGNLAAKPSVARQTFSFVNQVPRVAVLPFRTIGASTVPKYLSEGLVEDVVGMLASLREPVVISTDSTRRFVGLDLDLVSIGQRLNVSYCVLGTFRQSGGYVRLMTQLVETATAAVLWVQNYDTPVGVPFTQQDQIAASVANTLVPHIHAAELRRLRALHQATPSAYQHILEARELIFELEEGSFQRAGILLHEATKLEPSYAVAHSALASWYCLRMQQGWSVDPVSDRNALEQACRKAITLDAVNVRALALLGHNRTILNRSYTEAFSLFNKALQTSPNDSEAWLWSSPTFSYIGEGQEAVRRANKAIELSPYDPFLFRYHHFLSIAHYTAKNYEEAVHWGMQCFNVNPQYTSNLRTTAAALVALGRMKEATELGSRSMMIQPGFRVKAAMEHSPYNDPERRRRYGKALLAAGLAA